MAAIIAQAARKFNVNEADGVSGRDRWCTKAVIPLMIAQQGGRIIFISSVAARRGSSGTSVAYNAAKAGLIGLTVGLAMQLEGHGIRVNAITPGPTGTGQPMTPEELESERGGSRWESAVPNQLLTPACTWHGRVATGSAGGTERQWRALARLRKGWRRS